jgi:chemotaxis protein methyltransferase CheR
MTREKVSFPEEIRQRFKAFINNRTGLYFKDYDLKDLDAVIAERMRERGIETVLAYYTFLTASEQKEEELRELLNRLTINHTYFFRNEPQFKALKEKILPEIVARRSSFVVRNEQQKAADLSSLRGREAPEAISINGIASAPAAPRNDMNRPTIRIWSAGCSTGEEPYTIAMVIRDVIPDIGNWDIQILATDASSEALEAARKGVYGANSMRLVDAEHRDRYFTEAKKGAHETRYAVNDEIRKMVNFSFFNLMEEEYPSGFDCIFCRNVTIYFELETTVRVINKLERSLDKEGYLFIGYSETLQFISEKFKMLDWQDAIFYVKTPEIEAKRERFVPAAPAPTRRNIDEILEEISKAQFEAEKKDLADTKKRPARFDEALVDAIKAIHSKDYNRAGALIEEARSIDKNAVEPYYLSAEACVNQRRFDDAKRELEAAMEKNVMFAPAHYLLGTILYEEGRKEDAEKSYRRSLYLDKEFPLAHLNLGNTYKESGNINAALREFRNALNILSKARPYDILPFSGGFNVATLSSVCRNNIELLKTMG